MKGAKADAMGRRTFSKTLVMFDVDGTLTESFDLDSATYLDALRETFGFNDVSDDWAGYRNVTDAGILAEVFAARRGRLPTSDETHRMQTCFADMLAARIDAAGSVRPVAGAAALLSHLSEMPDEYAVAYASGGWGVTARLKLRSAGLPVNGVPGAFSDDDVSREGICRAAHRRAEARYGCELRTVVYVGDGGWDVRTSRQLGYGFIGVGHEGGAAKLRTEGAAEVLHDFQEMAAFFAAVRREAATASPVSPQCEGTAESAR